MVLGMWGAGIRWFCRKASLQSRAKLLKQTIYFSLKFYIYNKNGKDCAIVLQFPPFPQFNVVLLLLVYRKNAKLDFDNIDLGEKGAFFVKRGKFS